MLEQLHVKHNKSTAYHAQRQGALERFHQTLKSLLRAYCTELSGDWGDGLPWLLLLAREVVQDSTGFSPNELVFGHQVRGPLAVLQDGCLPEEPPQNIQYYVNGFRVKLHRAGELAKQKLQRAQGRMKKQYDKRAEARQFCPGDRVPALLSIIDSPFQAKYSGPFSVISQVTDLNNLFATPGRRGSTKLCHVNLLKPYYAHVSVSSLQPSSPVKLSLISSPVSTSSQTQKVPAEETGMDISPDDGLLQGRLKNSETLQNLKTLIGHFDVDKQKQ